MFPLIIDPQKLSVLVIGDGQATQRRIALLKDAGAEFEHIKTAEVAHTTYERVDVVFVADFDEPTSRLVYEEAKAANCVVNVEDKKEFCDFHVPAMVRRGELLLTVSTGGGSPRLARRLRMMLEQLFPMNWADRLQQVKQKRAQWKDEGASFQELADQTDALLDAEGWMEKDCPCFQQGKKEAGEVL